MDGQNGSFSRRRQCLRLLVGGALLTAVAPLWAQAGTKRASLRIVVPFAAGGTSDLVARLLAKHLPQVLDQTVMVDNRTGAGGNIGIASVARAAPDGRTVLLVSSSFVTNPALYPEGGPYDPIRQFEPVALIVTSPDVIVVRSDSSWYSLQDLVEAASTQVQGLTYSTPGTGNSVHLGGELLWQRTGGQFLHVPYAGAAPALVAVLGAQVDCGLTSLPAARAHLDSGALRALAVGSRERWPSLPDVPTVEQAGVSDYQSETLQALFAPAGTPAQEVARINAALVQVLAKEEVRHALIDQGFVVVGSTPQALAQRVAVEVPRWAAVARSANVRLD
ncbi:tripartite tricarboxylate transporter substrate binding protein [Alcaligenes sp. SORT26]|nr:tripartite tricarboxylate transporter substrate binding protein [Alcaligenes sp. SORT26]